MERIIVRRGRFLTYELLRRTFGDDPDVKIIWDRGRPPREWERLDYVFASGKRPKDKSEPSAS
jgi:hypothetical protein